MEKQTVLFITIDMIGHINPAIAIAEQIVSLGNRAIFALDKSWNGKISSKYDGIEEIYYTDPERSQNEQDSNKWIKSIKEMSKIFPLEGVEKLKYANSKARHRALYTLLNVDDQLAIIIKNLKPNVIYVDSLATVPAVWHCGIPWVRVCSNAPLKYIGSEDLPPGGSGLPTNGDRKEWEQYWEETENVYGELRIQFNKEMKEKYGIPPISPSTMILAHNSPYLNIYQYPKEMDYEDIRPIPDRYQRFDHLIRIKENDCNFEVPDSLLNNDLGSLIYVSMGTMGCADLVLMERLITILKESPNRFIFSLGPNHKYLKTILHSNMFGAESVPQTFVLQMVDLFITHGGNNSMIESLYFGRPMLVNPLFADQPENAQRLSETGLGYRINAYTCDPQEMLNKIEDLLHDRELKNKLKQISIRMQNSNATQKAALAILNLA
ncbi:hypothetical protein RDWZM_000314 [Blomia tropicalis]|uniref:UDP-glycosyltransferase n=1 Tax=Blomia tropicalis TaxID=40697 RepID=A0A9Q0RPG1_BLOTA|nr:hypothetical protein RDWZM_000314 [Blomia tropicalis]